MTRRGALGAMSLGGRPGCRGAAPRPLGDLELKYVSGEPHPCGLGRSWSILSGAAGRADTIYRPNLDELPSLPPQRASALEEMEKAETTGAVARRRKR